MLYLEVPVLKYIELNKGKNKTKVANFLSRAGVVTIIGYHINIFGSCIVL